MGKGGGTAWADARSAVQCSGIEMFLRASDSHVLQNTWYADLLLTHTRTHARMDGRICTHSLSSSTRGISELGLYCTGVC